MSKVLKLEALNEIINTMEAGDINKANQMVQIVMAHMTKEKKFSDQSEYIELENTTQEKLFHNIISEYDD